MSRRIQMNDKDPIVDSIEPKREWSWGEILEQLDKPRFQPSTENKWGLKRIMNEQRKYQRSNY